MLGDLKRTCLGLLALLFILALRQPAYGIPAFARKYGLRAPIRPQKILGRVEFRAGEVSQFVVGQILAAGDQQMLFKASARKCCCKLVLD